MRSIVSPPFSTPMSPTDDVWRWSDELASDPSSLVFLRLGEQLRRQGELALALKVALRGLERHPNHAEAQALVARITADRDALAVVAAPAPALAVPVAPAVLAAPVVPVAAPVPAPVLDPVQVVEALPIVHQDSRPDPQFPTSDGAQALLVDAQGLVLGGGCHDADGADIGQELAAHLSGISDEARRASHHLSLGGWRSIIIETDCAVIAMAPVGEGAVTVVTASRAMPLGMLRRVLTRCTGRAAEWVGAA